MSKESDSSAGISDLNKNLNQIEEELVGMQAILTKEWRTAKGEQKLELKKALDALNPVVEGFKKTKYTIEDKYGLEKLKSYIKPQIDKLTEYLKKPMSRVQNNEILIAVKDVLVSAYDFVESAIIATLDNAIKTGEFAQSIVDLGKTLTTGKESVSPEVQVGGVTASTHCKEVPTILGNVDQVEQGLNRAHELLYTAIDNSDEKQKAQLSNSLETIIPMIESFSKTKDAISHSKDGKQALDKLSYSSTALGGLQNWGEKQINSVASNRHVQKVTHNPSLNATMNVITTGGALLKTTVTNALDRAVKAGKVAESVVKLGAAVSNTVTRAAGVNKASQAR